MAQQKLYTEEQVREAMFELTLYPYDNGVDKILENLTPIELPNFNKLWDEFRIEHPNTIGGFKEQYECFIWMRDKILNK